MIAEEIINGMGVLSRTNTLKVAIGGLSQGGWRESATTMTRVVGDACGGQC